MFPVNVPNVLTVLRILAVPVVLVALLEGTPHGDLLAAVVFAAASLTDFVDGHLARARGSVTQFGKVMDPIADKLLVTAALIALVSLDRVAAWVAMVIIARELTVSMLRVVAGERGMAVPVNHWGKAKTACQVAAIFALIAVGSPPWVDALVYVTVAVTVVSGATYFLDFRRQARRRAAAQASSHSRTEV